VYLQNDARPRGFILEHGTADDLAYVGWEVADAAALKDFAARAQANGCAATAGTAAEAAQRGVKDLVKVADPGGLVHEAFIGQPQQPAADVPPSLNGRFFTGDLGIGHITLFIDQLDEHERFYREVLGMTVGGGRRRPSGQLEAVSTWRCNNRDHSVALTSLRGPLPGKHMYHIGLHLQDLTSVGQAYDKAIDGGLLVNTLGLHPGDRNVSFYMRTPAGFQVEYGYGSAEIGPRVASAPRWGHRLAKPDPDEWEVTIFGRPTRKELAAR
jgi:2,3-dihydroxybiphenyl 1,2-dioxygenase